MECNKAAKHCWLSHQTGGSENHGLESAGWESRRGICFFPFQKTAQLPVHPVLAGTRPCRWWKRSCATTRLSHKGEWLKTFVCRSESIGLGKMGIFGFQVKSKTRFRMYMESLSTYTNLPADVKPFMDWETVFQMQKKHNTFGVDLYCFFCFFSGNLES